MCLTHGSLFSGIGGFDLAAEWAGMTNVFNCDSDPFCRRTLKYHFPHAKQYSDIRTTDFTVWQGRVDVLSGGFPCQPFSMAGKRRGTDDDRYLWPEMLRAIREIRPKWVVGENVLGIVNWSDGLVFEQVCSDLENEGYCVQPFVLPACGTDAPHQRYRTWFVAHAVKDSSSNRCSCRTSEQERATVRKFGVAGARSSDRIHLQARIASDCSDARSETLSGRSYGTDAAEIAAHACDPRLEGTDKSGRRKNEEWLQIRRYLAGCSDEDATDTQSERLPQRNAQPNGSSSCTATERHNGIPSWDDFPTQPPVCGRNDGLSCWLDPAAVFAGIPERQRKRRSHVVRWRTEAIKCYGNAIVPQVVYRIFLTILR